jgi:hypothetical protein
MQYVQVHKTQQTQNHDWYNTEVNVSGENSNRSKQLAQSRQILINTVSEICNANESKNTKFKNAVKCTQAEST